MAENALSSAAMKNILLLFIHFVSTILQLCRPGGIRTVLAESVLLKHQLLIINCSRQRAPKLHPLDRILLGVWTRLMNPLLIARNAVILKPSSLLRFHHALVKKKYRLLLEEATILEQIALIQFVPKDYRSRECLIFLLPLSVKEGPIPESLQFKK